MKKILMLGGSFQQLVAIRKAKELGYYTVVCDYLPDNPGQYIADKFYPASTTDLDAVLKIACDEKVDGVVAYASDPAALTAAYVGEKLGLPTNPFKSVEILSEKHLFRKYLHESGFNAPNFVNFTEYTEEVKDAVSKLKFPVMVKPVDSSGSKGITRINDISELDAAVEYAYSRSRNHILLAEEYIQKDHKNMIGGDIFVVNGKVEFWGIIESYRDENVNPLVPTGNIYPYVLSEKRLSIVKAEVQKLVTSLDIKFGAFNLEMMITAEDKPYFIELGPRNGGNMIPDLLSMVSGKDMIGATIKCAMGDFDVDISFDGNGSFYATNVLHSSRDGKIKAITFDDYLEKRIVRKEIFVKPGDMAERFDGANKSLGIIFMRFESLEDRDETIRDIRNHIHIEVE